MLKRLAIFTVFCWGCQPSNPPISNSLATPEPETAAQIALAPTQPSNSNVPKLTVGMTFDEVASVCQNCQPPAVVQDITTGRDGVFATYLQQDDGFRVYYFIEFQHNRLTDFKASIVTH